MLRIIGANGSTMDGEGHVIDNSDGSYSGEYVIRGIGNYTLGVTHQGENIKGSPFNVWVSGADAAATDATGAGLVEAAVGVRSPFVIATRTAKREAVCIIDDDELQVRVDNEPVLYSQVGHALYSGWYEPRCAGALTVSITLRGAHINGSPFNLRVHPGSTDVSKCTASGVGLSQATCGDIASFAIMAKDGFGNAVNQGGLAFQCRLHVNVYRHVFRNVFRHACRHVGKHVCRHVYRHVGGDVQGCVFRFACV